LFANKRWKVRWTAATLLLRMSEAQHREEFMTALGKVKHMALGETLSYGGLLGALKGSDTSAWVARYSNAREPAPVRISALAYYFEKGVPADLPALQKLTSDAMPAPTCAPAEGHEADPDAASCNWTCTVTEQGQPVSQQVATVGEFVEYCLLPAVQARALTPAKEAAKASPAPSSGGLGPSGGAAAPTSEK
jgi:hypothetical protein